MENLKENISKVYYNHGLFCATHPAQVIVSVCFIVIILCFPLIQLPIMKDVPVDRVVLREDEFQAYRNSRLLFTHGTTNKSLGYSLQVVFHSTLLPPARTGCYLTHQHLVNTLQQSVEIVRLVREFRTPGTPSNFGGQSFEDICFQVEDRAVTSLEKQDTIFNVLPTFGCLFLAPSLLWDNDAGQLQASTSSLFARIKQAVTGNLRDLLFGLPWQLTGIRRNRVCSRQSTMAFVVTLVFREYNPYFITELRRHLLSRFPHGSRSTRMENVTESHSDADVVEDGASIDAKPASHVYMVWYRGRSYLSDYAPLILIYLVLLLYVYFSVCKLEMVKSKCGLAFSACFTVVASLCMSLGLCISIGLMVPTLNGSEIFPYLVVLIGFENVIILTKSVVATPIDLPVKYRIAQGLSKESWPLTKQYFTQLVLLGLGFFTFHPTMQEFCLFAVIGVTTDFFLQLFFFVTVLSIDIRRMELSDLSSQYQNLTCLRDSKTLFPVVPEHAVLISNANDSATFKLGPVKQKTFIPFVQYCFRRAYTIVGPMLIRTKRYGCKLVARIRPSFKPRHRRRVSAAEAAAFLASDETPTANVPRRLWLLRIWAKHRLVQNLFVFSIALWIVVVILYTLNFSQFLATWRTQQPSSTVSSPVDESYHTDDSNLSSPVNLRTPQLISNSDHLSSSSETAIYSPTGILKAELHIQANASRIDRALRQLETSGLFNDARRGHLLLQSTHATWDGTLLWNYLAFFQWPLLAKHYNLSLAGCHSVILEPIHLTHKVQASPVTMDTHESVLRPSPYGVSESQADKQRKVGWNNWSWYDFWLDASSSLINVNRDTDGVEMQDGKEVEVVDGGSRLAGFEDLLHLLGVSKSTGEHRRGRRPSSSVSPGGVGGWTARLWLTASILGTSFVGCSCVLLVTCLGMICFQELQAKSTVPSHREPVIRVLPLTIPLTESAECSVNPEMDTDSEVLRTDWTVTCGNLKSTGSQGVSQMDGIIAACALHPSLHDGSSPTDIIRLWCTNSGQELPPLDRYSNVSVVTRQNAADYLKCSYRRRSTVWSMCFLTGGSLLVGCSDGTIEVWDCVSNVLQCMLCCNWAVANSSDAADILEPDSSCGQHLRLSHPGGVTVLLVINSVSFCVGTSRGHVALFDLNNRATEPIMSLARRASRQWHMHSRPVTQLGFMRLIDGLCEPSERSDLFVVVSASEDGSIAKTMLKCCCGVLRNRVTQLDSRDSPPDLLLGSVFRCMQSGLGNLSQHFQDYGTCGHLFAADLFAVCW
ncbi:hypothetical protein P879_08897 [Paragonimus westermani]|uniref:Sterol regulatory element-binding protein cleavage-activating protein n=1 Tax=Paragonimus westermani TaxID=34504 RepID=A0A8T0DJ68_9TREM|nr:hypothetical protein P879_08897 [Paragonimus westermani]